LFGLLLAFGAAAAAEPDGRSRQPSASPPGTEELGFSVAPGEGGKARTSLFGIVGEGYKFVYVFDRSGSMGGPSPNALQAAKAELIHSLKLLDTVHQFQVVFYNERPSVFNPTGDLGRLVFATESNKQRAARFINSIAADGGTNHEDALRTAIHLNPDVIYFLTDADDPKLTPRQLEKIRHLAAGIIIHTIRFGEGPRAKGDDFLIDLASQNGGQHADVDILTLRTAAGANPVAHPAEPAANSQSEP
jgi:hypothetical protein